MTTKLEAVPGAVASRGGSRTASGRARLRVVRPARPLELDTVAMLWQRALDAALSAVMSDAGRSGLPDPERGRRRRLLAAERQETASLLTELAREARIRPAPWLSAVPITREMLGLSDSVRGCLFDLDGVLTNSDVLQASAWAEVFDDLLLRQSHATGWQFKPFDVETDYDSYVSGRTRLEGIHSFLESRGLRLPEGRPSDPRESDTAHGVAKRKSEALAHSLEQHRVKESPHARRYLEAAGRVGVARAVVSASASTSLILESARLATLVDVIVDADVVRGESLRSRPAPDVLIATCRRLGVDPAQAVTFTGTPAGIAAARSAGIDVIGIADDRDRGVLSGFGADRTVPSLGSLIDRRLLDAGP